MSDLCPHSDYIEIKPGLVIPMTELNLQFSRGTGPGGQNVNRRETQVEIVFDLRNSPSLTAEQRSQLLGRLASRLDGSGHLHVVAHAQRSQYQNREAALSRFAHLLRHGLETRRRRHPTRPSSQAVRRRLERKRRHGESKKARRPAIEGIS